MSRAFGGVAESRASLGNIAALAGLSAIVGLLVTRAPDLALVSLAVLVGIALALTRLLGAFLLLFSPWVVLFPRLPEPFARLDLIDFTVLAGGFVCLLDTGSWMRTGRRLLGLGAVFFAVTLASALIHFRSLSTSLKHPVLLMIYLCFLAVGEREGRAGGEPRLTRAVSLHLFTVGTVAVAVLVMVAARAGGTGFELEQRVEINPALSGGFLGTYIAGGLILCLARLDRRGARAPELLTLVVLGLALLATFARSGWILAAGGCFVILWRQSRPLVLAGVAFLALTAVAVAPLRERVLDQVVPGRAYNTIFLRTPIWKDAWRLWQTAPLLGTGPGNFYFLTSSKAVREAGADYIGSVHNNYLEVLVDSGLIGLAVFLFWLVAALRALTRPERRLRLGLLPWGLGLSVAALFGDFLIAAPQNNGFATVHLSGLFWLLTGMGASAGEATK